MASANFTVNAAATPPAIAVAANTTVTLALTDSAFRTVAWTIEGNHSPSASNPTITPGGSPLGATATFTMPNVPGGQGFLVQAVVNNGRDDEGAELSTLTKRAIVGVVGADGQIPFVAGEISERLDEYGWTVALNEKTGGSGARLALTGQLASISNANLVTSPAAGLWEVDIYLSTTTAGSAGTVLVTIGHTDRIGATTQATSTLALDAQGRLRDRKLVYVASSHLTYATTVAGASGSPQYALDLSARRVSLT